MNYQSVNHSLLRAVNLANPQLAKDIQLEDVTFGTPELYLMGQCNTRIRLTAKDSSVNFKNNGQFFYNRNRLDWFLRDIRIPGQAKDCATTQDVVAKLVASYGLPLVPTEYLNTTLYAPIVELQPSLTNVGFFTNFVASLTFMDEQPFVTNGQTVNLTAWPIQDSAGKSYDRRSMAIDASNPNAAPYLGALNNRFVAVGDNPRVQIRAVETGADIVDGIASWKWLSIQFFGNIPDAHLSSFARINGVWARQRSHTYNPGTGLTYRTYEFSTTYVPPVDQPLNIDF